MRSETEELLCERWSQTRAGARGTPRPEASVSGRVRREARGARRRPSREAVARPHNVEHPPRRHVVSPFAPIRRAEGKNTAALARASGFETQWFCKTGTRVRDVRSGSTHEASNPERGTARLSRSPASGVPSPHPPRTSHVARLAGQRTADNFFFASLLRGAGKNDSLKTAPSSERLSHPFVDK